MTDPPTDPLADPLTADILAALAGSPEGMSLPRLGKRTGLSASVLLRRLHGLSTAAIGGAPGPGWVRVESQEARWMAFITEAGLSAHHASPLEPGAPAHGKNGH